MSEAIRELVFEVLTYAVAALAGAVLSFVAAWSAKRLSGGGSLASRAWHDVWAVAGAGSVGICVGAMTGASRVGVVGEVLPVLLTGAGAVAAMLLASRGSARKFMLVGSSMAFAVSCLGGAVLGAAKREYALNSPEALARRATLVALCKAEEYRAIQMARGMKVPNPQLSLNCEQYPIR